MEEEFDHYPPVGKGLSRYSKYTREQRARIGRVTAAVLGEKAKMLEPKGRKYGVARVEKIEDKEDAKDQWHMVAQMWYASKKRRDDAYRSLKRKADNETMYWPIHRDRASKMAFETLVELRDGNHEQL